MLCGITNSQYEENPQGQFVWHNHHLLPWPSTSTAASSYLTRGVDFSIKVKVGCLRTDGYNLYDESPTIACKVKQKKKKIEEEEDERKQLSTELTSSIWIRNCLGKY